MHTNCKTDQHTSFCMSTEWVLKERETSSRKKKLITYKRLFFSSPSATATSWSLNGHWGNREDACSFWRKPWRQPRTKISSGFTLGKCAFNLAVAVFSNGQGEYASDLCFGISIAHWQAALSEHILEWFRQSSVYDCSFSRILIVPGKACAHRVRYSGSKHE